MFILTCKSVNGKVGRCMCDVTNSKGILASIAEIESTAIIYLNLSWKRFQQKRQPY